MTNITITGLPNLSSLTPDALLPTDVANTTYSITATAVQNFMLNTTGNVNAGNVLANNTIQGNAVLAGNVSVTGVVSATGNVYANYFIGNGSQLAGVKSLNTGSFSITQVGNYLVFYFQGNAIAYLDGQGNFNTANNVTGYANITV